MATPHSTKAFGGSSAGFLEWETLLQVAEDTEGMAVIGHLLEEGQASTKPPQLVECIFEEVLKLAPLAAKLQYRNRRISLFLAIVKTQGSRGLI